MMTQKKRNKDTTGREIRNERSKPYTTQTNKKKVARKQKSERAVVVGLMGEREGDNWCAQLRRARAENTVKVSNPKGKKQDGEPLLVFCRHSFWWLTVGSRFSSLRRYALLERGEKMRFL